MLDRLGDACFVVIAYLVGARASEILRLAEGCLERRAADGDGEEHVYLVGTITKTSLTEHGDIHRWLAPEPVRRALHLLRTEELRVGKEWVRTCRSGWVPDH